MAGKKRDIGNIKNKRIFEKSSENYDFVYRNFLIGVDYIKEIRNYIWFATALFLIISIIGFFFPVFFVENVKEMIEELIAQTAGLSGWRLISFIIANNIQSAFTAMAFGVFFAVVPIGIVFVNGYVLGFVANMSSQAEGVLILWRLLPHGIFEIPAIMISIGIGIKLGSFLFVYHGKNKRKEFLKWLANSIRAFLLVVVPLLVIAGTIEGILISIL
jgi:stage II sporulation protein M